MRLDGDFTWEESQPPALVGIDLSIKQGDLIAVVGSTGDVLDGLVLACAALHATFMQTMFPPDCNALVIVDDWTGWPAGTGPW